MNISMNIEMHAASIHMLYMKTAKIRYHRGPLGGGISRAINPLMQIVAGPSPVLRIY
jgi:hypothetical protein